MVENNQNFQIKLKIITMGLLNNSSVNNRVYYDSVTNFPRCIELGWS